MLWHGADFSFAFALDLNILNVWITERLITSDTSVSKNFCAIVDEVGEELLRSNALFIRKCLAVSLPTTVT